MDLCLMSNKSHEPVPDERLDLRGGEVVVLVEIEVLEALFDHLHKGPGGSPRGCKSSSTHMGRHSGVSSPRAGRGARFRMSGPMGGS